EPPAAESAALERGEERHRVGAERVRQEELAARRDGFVEEVRERLVGRGLVDDLRADHEIEAPLGTLAREIERARTPVREAVPREARGDELERDRLAIREANVSAARGGDEAGEADTAAE